MKSLGAKPCSGLKRQTICLWNASTRATISSAPASTTQTCEAVRGTISSGAEKLFSTHGYFDVQDVNRSNLVMADGPLTLPEIAAMDLRGTWLAVLSACQTGRVDPSQLLDEYYGLPASFLVAGAQTVVASLWSVSDFSTALLMERFHQNLYRKQNPLPKAAALREAQQWVRDLPIEEIETWLDKHKDQLADAGAFARMSSTATAGLAFVKKRIRESAKQNNGKPLANPYWWAAFQCIGAGWPAE